MTLSSAHRNTAKCIVSQYVTMTYPSQSGKGKVKNPTIGVYNITSTER